MESSTRVGYISNTTESKDREGAAHSSVDDVILVLWIISSLVYSLVGGFIVLIEVAVPVPWSVSPQVSASLMAGIAPCCCTHHCQ